MSLTSQAAIAALAATIIAADRALCAHSISGALGWSLAAWCCISAAAGACFLRGLEIEQ